MTRMASKLMAALLAGASGVLFLLAMPASASQFPPAQSGVHVYDQAQALSSSQLSRLEADAATAAQSGLPNVVYIEAVNEDSSAAQSDAHELMNEWGVESPPGAKNGLVIFVALIPGNLRHGSVGLWAGQYAPHLDSSVLDSTYSSKMVPALQEGDVTAAVENALSSLTATVKGATPPSGGSGSPSIGSFIFPVLFILVFAGVFIAGIVQAFRRRGFGYSGMGTGYNPYVYNDNSYNDSGGGAGDGGSGGGGTF